MAAKPPNPLFIMATTSATPAAGRHGFTGRDLAECFGVDS